MKTFHIKRPRPGDRSAAVVGYEYNRERGRTRTVYLGSVRVDANPDAPEAALRARPNTMLGGLPYRVTPEHLEVVREWLMAHGSYLAKKLQEEETERLNRARIEEQERFRIERLTESLRKRFEQEWRAEFDSATASQTTDPLEAAIKAVLAACRFVRDESARLREGGARLSRIRSTQLDVDQCRTELDKLQARTNQLRLRALVAFETDCKEAGLMAAQKRGRSRVGSK